MGTYQKKLYGADNFMGIMIHWYSPQIAYILYVWWEIRAEKNVLEIWEVWRAFFKILGGEYETGIALLRAQFSCMINNLFLYQTA